MNKYKTLSSDRLGMYVNGRLTRVCFLLFHHLQKKNKNKNICLRQLVNKCEKKKDKTFVLKMLIVKEVKLLNSEIVGSSCVQGVWEAVRRM